MRAKYRKPHSFKRKTPILKSRLFWPVLLVIFIVPFLVYYLLFSDVFKVKEIIVSGNKELAGKVIMELAESELKKEKSFFGAGNIFLLNTLAIKTDILNNLYKVEEVEIKRKLPESLNILVIEREGRVLFCQEKEIFAKDQAQVFHQTFFLLDKKGVAFEEFSEKSPHLPLIKKKGYGEDIFLGKEIINENLISGVSNIFNLLGNLNIETKEFLIVSEERLNVRVSEGWEIYFDPKKDLNWQLEKLKAVLEKNMPSEKREDLEYIELRFGNLAPFKYRQEEE